MEKPFSKKCKTCKYKDYTNYENLNQCHLCKNYYHDRYIKESKKSINGGYQPQGAIE